MKPRLKAKATRAAVLPASQTGLVNAPPPKDDAVVIGTAFLQRADNEAVMLAMQQRGKPEAINGVLAQALKLGMRNRNARVGVAEVREAFGLKA